MHPLNLLIASLAVWEVVEIWRHSGLMSSLRARAELLEGWTGRLLNCPFCLSVWLGVFAVPFAMPKIEPTRHFSEDPAVWVWYGVHTAGFMLMCGFAIARLANLGNDLTHDKCRTPRENKLELGGEKKPDYTQVHVYVETAVLLELLKQSESKTTFEKKEEDGGSAEESHGSGGGSGPTAGAEADVRPGGV